MSETMTPAGLKPEDFQSENNFLKPGASPLDAPVKKNSRPLSVMVIEDSQIVRERLAARIARFAGVAVVATADNGLEGLRLISEHHPDVVLLDIELPGMTGLKVLERLKLQKPKPVIIVLTTYAFAELRQRCLDLGADHFLSKAMEFEDALHIIEALAQRLRERSAGKEIA